MVKVTFEYRDELSNYEWRRQVCVTSSVQECKKIYGLGIDCDYRIISVEKLWKRKGRKISSFLSNNKL